MTYGAAWQTGWEFDQEWYDDPDTVDIKDGQYKLAAEIYSRQSFAFASLFDVDRLYYNNTQFTVESFKALLSLEVYYFYESRRTCIFSYTTIDDFTIIMEVQQRLIQCYKDVIQTLWTLDNWTSIYAQYIDKCDMSTPETITPISYDLNAAQFSSDIIGKKQELETANDDIDTADCLPGFIWEGTFLGLSMGLLHDNLATYVFEKLGAIKK